MRRNVINIKSPTLVKLKKKSLRKIRLLPVSLKFLKLEKHLLYLHHGMANQVHACATEYCIFKTRVVKGTSIL